jgi:tripeptide aminopeptidase
MTLLERFKRFVQIDNPSGGEAEIRQAIAQELSAMGVTEQHVDSAGNLFVRVPGRSDKETLMLSAHMDSVPPCHGIVPVEDTQDGRAIIRSEGRTILGADDRAGIAVTLAVVEALAAQNFQENHPLELMFSAQEEVGLLGAKAFDMSQVRSAYAYVLDGEGQVGEIFNAGASQESLLITCHGRAAHAGICPEEGVSAIQMGAALVNQLPAGRLAPTLTTNLGVVQGGKAMNVVAPELTLRGEARGHSEMELNGLLDTYQKTCQAIEARFPGSRIEFVHQRRYNSFVVDPALPVVQRAVSMCEEMGIAPVVLPMNIGSDAHILNHGGLPTVVLGMGFHYSHSLGEFLYCEELERVFALVHALVLQ